MTYYAIANCVNFIVYTCTCTCMFVHVHICLYMYMYVCIIGCLVVVIVWLLNSLQELLAQFNSCQSEFYSLLSKYEEDLFNTPFDQTKFLQHIDIVKTQIMECKKLKDEKSRAMKVCYLY